MQCSPLQWSVFGDFDYKSNNLPSFSCQAIICTPEILAKKREIDTDMYLIPACDGIWDVLSTDEVGLFVANKIEEHCTNMLSSGGNEHDKLESNAALAKVGDALLELCVDKKSKDNLSVLIIAFPASALGEYGTFSKNPRASKT